MQQEVIEILERVGAIMLDDHFVGTSGRHLEGYINKDALFPHSQEGSRIGEIFAKTFNDLEMDVVAAPAMGGIILAQWTAYHLSNLKSKEIMGVYAEKIDDKLKFTRGFDKILKNKKVLVIEDLTTTGGSLKKVIDAVKENGGNVIMSSVMVNRDPELVTAETFGVPFQALAELEIKSYDEKDCPMCKNGISVNTSVGHGKKYIESNGS
jgi:orotate phosphoribosyltransferase